MLQSKLLARIIGDFADVKSSLTGRAGSLRVTELYPKFGFTLAEVLITLGIIGVVAALTLPAIIQKQQKVEAVTRLKKSYSLINQAFKMAESKNGPIDSWAEWDDAEVILDKYIIPEIRGAKKYGKATDSRLALCYDANSKSHIYGEDKVTQYTWFNGVYISSPFYKNVTASFKLPDGSCIGLNPSSYKDENVEDSGVLTTYGTNIFIDINSSKGPNIAGDDLFFFVLDKNTIRSYGYNWPKEDIASQSKSNSCHRKSNLGGYTCAARIMSEGWQIKY